MTVEADTECSICLERLAVARAACVLEVTRRHLEVLALRAHFPRGSVTNIIGYRFIWICYVLDIYIYIACHECKQGIRHGTV